MVAKYILGIDQGTTGTKAMIIDDQGNVLAQGYREHRQIFPQPGWVEHDPEEIWLMTMEAVQEALDKTGLAALDLAAIGLDNQGETVMAWDKVSGKPYYNAIVWQCRRTAEAAEALKQRPDWEEKVRSKTGLIIDCYFSATKIRWLLDNAEGIGEGLAQGKVLVGTLDSWLIWKMTGGRAHVTDYSTASRTMLFNIHSLEWDAEILAELGIPRELLARVLPTGGTFGYTDKEVFFGASIPITGSAVDQQAALFGQACFEAGMVKNTYGTGCFMLMNTGTKPAVSKNGLLSTVAWGIGQQKVYYALDGGVYVAGSAIQWLRDGIKIIASAADTEQMALSVRDSGGVYFVPAFSGLAAPYWDMWARGTVVGITGSTTREHLVRATLEAIAFQVKEVLMAMEADVGQRLKVLRVDGGPVQNRFLMQFQADILGIPVEVPEISETTALGAAYLAGLGAKVWQNEDELRGRWKLKRRYEPAMEERVREGLFSNWQAAVRRSQEWIKEVTQLEA